MRRQLALAIGEEIRWEGRPAPRCYTFRHWRHSLFGLIFLSICSYWQILGLEFSKEYEIVWLAWLPLPFLLMGLYLTVGHLFQARLEWNHVYYALTDRRLLTQRGLMTRRVEFLELHEITYFSLHFQGEQLGTLQVYKGQKKRLTLHCVEHPRQLTALLEEAMGDKASSVPPKAQ
jgi:hypothetical protein